MARRGKLNPERSSLEPGLNAETNLGMEFQLLNFCTNLVFDLSQPGKSQPSNLVLDPLELIGATEAWVGFNVVDGFTRQDLMNGNPIAQRDLFEPIHHFAQMILADL